MHGRAAGQFVYKHHGPRLRLVSQEDQEGSREIPRLHRWDFIYRCSRNTASTHVDRLDEATKSAYRFLMTRVPVKPELLRWARKRAGLDASALVERFPKYEEWESGEAQPTLKQLEAFARFTTVPFGYLFLPEPPEEKLPIPDFRTLGDRPLGKLSPDLMEMIHAMQRRQDWMRDYLTDIGAEPLPFVGSVTLATDPEDVARRIRETLGLVDGWAREHATWSAAQLGLRRAAEQKGVLIVINGIVGNNVYRKLNPDEFRGFVLCDRLAPLIFLNGADFKAAQMFTLAHELAHVWLGRDGISNLPDLQPGTNEVEQFCNRVAAEVLIPAAELRQCWDRIERADEPFQVLARQFKVSPMVAARRVLDLGYISREVFLEFLRAYAEDERRKAETKTSGEGNFYATQETRIGRRFGSAVVRAVREGRLLYREAYRLTGLSGKTFDQYAERLGIGL